jgi:phosphatidylcholine synthase
VAWSVHLLTASGAAWGFLALGAIDGGNWRLALVWMAVATAMDAIDGPLARRFRVCQILPGFDGTLLDNLVDYFNYAVVPAWFVAQAGLLPQGLGLPAAAAIGLASAFQFSRSDAKTPEGSFTGFPSYWNIVAFYLAALRPVPWVAIGVVAGLCALVFVPVRYIHPVRTREFRPLTLGLTALWAVSLGVVLALYPDHPRWLVLASLLYAAYYGVASLVLHLRGVSS